MFNYLPHLRLSIVSVLLVGCLAIAGCAGDGGDGGFAEQRAGAGKIEFCKRGDQMVASSNQCLLDDAACYQISNGQWCTGERGNVCPAGSTEIPAGAACPSGARCIAYGESLNCAIMFQ